ncbi:hypothetical protein GMJLKIPL_1164 [Methylobacterium isbiliense]|uniref:Uncharacterized protein n=1 Tax=Methylobacterium isbiliense TaxID=315478 RepID=A0ABQ4S7T5_9HYPH|nr:hypothetical protein GMJLKIPL_1164 [Methylobacterium isbiliense]
MAESLFSGRVPRAKPSFFLGANAAPDRSPVHPTRMSR